MLDYIEIDTDFAMVKTKPPRAIVSVPLRGTRLRARYGVTVVAVTSQARGEAAVFTCPTPDTVLMSGDVILVVGRICDVERFAEVD